MGDSVLDPETVVKLWKRLGGCGSVTKYLAKNGVINPNTGEPYSKATIVRIIRRSGAREEKLRRAAPEVKKRRKRSRDALRRACKKLGEK